MFRTGESLCLSGANSSGAPPGMNLASEILITGTSHFLSVRMGGYTIPTSLCPPEVVLVATGSLSSATGSTDPWHRVSRKINLASQRMPRFASWRGWDYSATLKSHFWVWGMMMNKYEKVIRLGMMELARLREKFHSLGWAAKPNLSNITGVSAAGGGDSMIPCRKLFLVLLFQAYGGSEDRDEEGDPPARFSGRLLDIHAENLLEIKKGP